MKETKINAESSAWKRRIRTIIPIMLVLLLIFPFEIEIRLNTETFSITAELLAWTWAYRLIDSVTGFYTPPTWWYLQQPLLYTIFHFVFLAALIGYQWELVSKKDTMNIGLFSLVPGIFVMTVNIVLGILVPFGSIIIAPIPIPIAPILGLLVLRTSEIPVEGDSWLNEDPNIKS
ncbi:MAG: hypothetical protein ACFE7R_08035 [Candidatus Hodarchaeota archaeon]